jgi:hypothetical protein
MAELRSGQLTEADLHVLPAGVVKALRCPVGGCDRLLIRTPDGDKGRLAGYGGWCCPTLGHTGLAGDYEVSELVREQVPEAIRKHDPQRTEHIIEYAMRRGREAWATDEQIKRAQDAGAWKKSRKKK